MDHVSDICRRNENNYDSRNMSAPSDCVTGDFFSNVQHVNVILRIKWGRKSLSWLIQTAVWREIVTGFLACLPTKGLFILNAKIPDGLFPEKCKQIYTSMNHKQIHLGTTKQYNRYNIMIISSINIFSHQHPPTYISTFWWKLNVLSQ